MIRPDPHDADAAQARVFVGLLTEAISAVAEAVENAERATANARLINAKRAERQATQFASDLRGDLKDLKSQLAAIQRRFPIACMPTAALDAVSA